MKLEHYNMLPVHHRKHQRQPPPPMHAFVIKLTKNLLACRCERLTG